MTEEKILEVLDLYERGTAILSDSYSQHLCQMVPQMREFLADGQREKAMRWLGFMQGAFWVRGTYTIEELMAHNKPDNVEFDESA